MILTFKRIECDSDTEITTKINDFLGFPLTLDMRSYASSSDTNNNNLKYELQAVINHHGESGRGHYYLYLKINGSWYEFDDSKEVTQVSERIVCHTNSEANTLVYCRSNDVENIMNQLNVQPPIVIQASTRPPSASGRPERAARQEKTSTRPPSAPGRPPKRAAATRQVSSNVSASQQKKKRGSSNITAAKPSTASTRKKQKTAEKVSSQSRKRKRRQIQRKRFKEIEDDKKMQDEKNRSEQVPYFEDEFPDGMEILEERTNTKNDITLQNKFYCRNKLCTHQSYGKGGEKELCKTCATRVRQFRRKLEFDKEFQFQLVDDFDDKLGRMNGEITMFYKLCFTFVAVLFLTVWSVTTLPLALICDSLPNTYISIISRNITRTYESKCQGNRVSGLNTILQSDSALVRQCLCYLLNEDIDVNMSRRNPLEDYLGKREKEANEDTPPLKDFIQELALWLFNKFYDEYKTDEDLKDRLRTILGYLEDPTQLHKLWEGEKFEPQGINCTEEELDVRQQFKCLHSLYDKNGHIRSTFDLRGIKDHHQEKKKMIAAIDTISMAFERDVDHHSRDETSSWFDREDDVKAFKKWLKLQRDILSCDNDDDLTQLVMEFKRQVQATIDEINIKKEDATIRRQQDDTTHPAVAHEQECNTRGNLPPNYEKYMKDIIVSLLSLLYKML